TPLAQSVLGALPAPTSAGVANNYQILQEFTNDTDKYSGKLDVQLTPALRGFARFGHRAVDLYDQPPIPLPSGGAGNGFTYVNNKQLALGLTYTPGSTQLVELRLGWSKTQAGKNPPALGSPGADEAYGISGLPTDPRVAGGLPAQLISGYSDLGRQATN